MEMCEVNYYVITHTHTHTHTLNDGDPNYILFYTYIIVEYFDVLNIAQFPIIAHSRRT